MPESCSNCGAEGEHEDTCAECCCEYCGNPANEICDCDERCHGCGRPGRDVTFYDGLWCKDCVDEREADDDTEE